MKKTTTLSSDRPHFAEWAVLCGLFAVVVFSNSYADIWDTSSNGLYLWDMLFSGRLLEFYAHAPAATDYPITVYLTFAVVNLPIYILKAIFRFAPDAQWWFIAYNKLFICGFFAVSALLLNKVCLKLGLDKERRWVCFAYASSIIAMYTIPVVGQYDILAVIFVLLGLLDLFEERYWRFILWFSIALTFKYLAVFALIPLLLYRQKNIFKALGALAASAVPTLLLMRRGLIFRWALNEDGLSRGTSILVGWFGEPDALFGSANISFFVLAYCAVCVFAYIKPWSRSVDARRMAVYIGALAYSALFLFTPSHSYWFIMLTPFISLIMFFDLARLNEGIFINTVAATCEVLCFESFTFISCTGYHAVANSLIGNLFPLDPTVSYSNSQSVMNSILTALGLTDYQAVAEQCLGTVFVCGLLSLLILFYPRGKKGTLKVNRWVMWFRVLCCAVIAVLPVLNIIIGATK